MLATAAAIAVEVEVVAMAAAVVTEVDRAAGEHCELRTPGGV